MPKWALYSAAAVFAVVAVLHLARFLAGTRVVIGEAEIPVILSLPAGAEVSYGRQ
jgi:hypothetical protein